ncbi:hypothetical protein DL769_001738 [Monosporascus sp. CRB-8-3]|nr:hypothetical protein DL769_001738 [Monosporascus sp. CRB-8-3]
MASRKTTASGKDVGGQAEGFDMEQLMKAFATLSNEGQKKGTYLHWKDFDFKLSEENRLRGSDNWEIWDKKQSALDYVVDFKNLVTMFINSIRDHDGDI